MQEQFGISFVQIISYVVIFLLLYIFARKFVKKLLVTTHERQLIIEEGLENAQKVEVLKAEKLKEIELEKHQIIQDAYKHAHEILEKAKSKEEHLLNEAKEKSSAIIKDAEKDIEEMKTRSKEEGLKEAREIIALSIKKAFSDLTLDEKTEEKLIEESLKNL